MAKRDVIDVLIAEAIGEGDEGLAAVAWTIMNRAAETGRTPAQVIADPGDYTGATSPGSATKKAMKDPKVRARVERVWNQVQSGSIPDPTGGATHYWAPKGMKGGKAPYWADEEESAAGRLKIGNHVFLPKQKPNSALAAINAVAPTPMPSRPVALSYSQNTAIPSVPAPRSSAPPGMRSLIEGNAAFGVLPFDTKPDPASYAPNYGIDLNARDLNPPIVPARGVGTSYLAPATKVKTVPIDPVTGNPILAQATPSPRSPVGYGPSWDNLQGMTVGAWDDAAPWNNVGPRPKPFVGGVVPSQSKQTPQQIANERIIAGIPVLGPLAVGLGTLPALLGNTRTASATPQPQPTKLPSVIPEKAGPPAPPRSVPKSDTSIGSFVTQFGSNTGKPAPLPPKPPKSSDRLVAGDVQKDAFVKTYYPDMYSPEAIKRGQDIASALYPKPTPTLPRLPTPAMSAARLPVAPPAPVLVAASPMPRARPQIAPTAPRAPARVPLAAMGTVNPMSQIVPAVQARAGQTLFGRLFNNMTSGVVPQAAAPTNRPAWQNNPNVQRDDKWAGVLDNFGMII